MQNNEETKKPFAAAENPAKQSAQAATEDKDTVKIDISAEDETIDNVVEFTKRYDFEGKTIDKIDLSGIEDMSGATAQKVEQLYRKITKNISASPETTLDYAMAIASILTDLPVEFFKQINAKDLMKIKIRVVNFYYGD